jgi:hypothetical protein
MDTSDYPSLPNLAQMHARLAVDNGRVESMIDAQLDGIERLFVATTAEDWGAVAEVTRQLAEMKPEEISAEVIQNARQLCQELGKMKKKPLKAPKHLANLLAACRAVRQRTR